MSENKRTDAWELLYLIKQVIRAREELASRLEAYRAGLDESGAEFFEGTQVVVDCDYQNFLIEFDGSGEFESKRLEADLEKFVPSPKETAEQAA